ncbi:hypothetical protein HG530_014317 [Fusarium avenaceum]|nr:hypothetical protein HG530_014317 [Fusarium avenaceum]
MLANMTLELGTELGTKSANTPHLRRESCPFSAGEELGFFPGTILRSLPFLARTRVKQDIPAKLEVVLFVLVCNKFNELLFKTDALSHVGLCEDTDVIVAANDSENYCSGALHVSLGKDLNGLDIRLRLVAVGDSHKTWEIDKSQKWHVRAALLDN